MSLCLPMFLVLLLCIFLLFVCFVLGYLGVFYFNLGNYFLMEETGVGMHIRIGGEVGRVCE